MRPPTRLLASKWTSFEMVGGLTVLPDGSIMWRQFILDPDEEGWSDGEVYVTCEGPDMYQAGWSKHGATLNAPQRDTVLGSLEALRDVAIAMQIRLDTPRVFR